MRAALGTVVVLSLALFACAAPAATAPREADTWSVRNASTWAGSERPAEPRPAPAEILRFQHGKR